MAKHTYPGDDEQRFIFSDSAPLGERGYRLEDPFAEAGERADRTSLRDLLNANPALNPVPGRQSLLPNLPADDGVFGDLLRKMFPGDDTPAGLIADPRDYLPKPTLDIEPLYAKDPFGQMLRNITEERPPRETYYEDIEEKDRGEGVTFFGGRTAIMGALLGDDELRILVLGGESTLQQIKIAEMLGQPTWHTRLNLLNESTIKALNMRLQLTASSARTAISAHFKAASQELDDVEASIQAGFNELDARLVRLQEGLREEPTQEPTVEQ